MCKVFGEGMYGVSLVAEIAALPADMQARFLRLATRRRPVASSVCRCRRLDSTFTHLPATTSHKIAQWRATADEDGHYCFAVAL